MQGGGDERVDKAQSRRRRVRRRAGSVRAPLLMKYSAIL